MSAAPATVDWSAYDYLDLGCSRGASLQYGALRFDGRRGIGVDRNPAKVAAACRRGVDAVVGDATDLGLDKQVRFALLMDFLEHLPDLAAVQQALAGAAAAATDFLFIFHPSFEGEPWLRAQGLRLHWWEWDSHTTHIRIADYCRIFDRLGLHRYKIRYVKPITDAGHSAVLRDDEPANETGFDPGRHRSKPDLRFPEPLWRAQEIFVCLRDMPADEWARIVRPWKETALYDVRVRGAAG
jgi:hypothetical protein